MLGDVRVRAIDYHVVFLYYFIDRMSDGEDCGGVIAAPAPSRRRNRKLWKTSVRLVLEKQPRSVRQEVMIETEEIEASDIDQIKFEKNQVSKKLKDRFSLIISL